MTDTTLAARIRDMDPLWVTNGITGPLTNIAPALADLVEVVESRHWLQHGRDCAECGDEWPCPTATALDALAAALEVA